MTHPVWMNKYFDNANKVFQICHYFVFIIIELSKNYLQTTCSTCILISLANINQFWKADGRICFAYLDVKTEQWNRLEIA